MGVFLKLLHIAFFLSHWIEGEGVGKEKVESFPVVVNARACAAVRLSLPKSSARWYQPNAPSTGSKRGRRRPTQRVVVLRAD